MARRNIVLLSTDSRESESKKLHYTEAAASLGLEVRAYPDRRTECVLACSDFRAVDAAWLCKLHGIPGSDPIAASIASQKSLTYQFLQSRGFRTLHWQLPIELRDLQHSFDRPVIVKPDRGSGSFARHPWGYRVFASVDAFRRYLVRNRLLGTFLRYQADPSSGSGRYIVMEYVACKSMFGVASIIGAKRATVYDVHGMRAMSRSMIVDRILFGERHRDMASVAAVAQAFAEIGLRRTVLYVQCVERAGKLYPIDINLRPGTMFDLAASALGHPFYKEALSVFLGRQARMRFSWPSKCVGVRRMSLPLKAGTRRATFGPGGIPLIEKFSYDPARPYDLGHAWPTFAVQCSDRVDFDRRAGSVIARTIVRAARGRDG
jgi:hypothetical protein